MVEVSRLSIGGANVVGRREKIGAGGASAEFCVYVDGVDSVGRDEPGGG